MSKSIPNYLDVFDKRLHHIRDRLKHELEKHKKDRSKHTLKHLLKEHRSLKRALRAAQAEHQKVSWSKSRLDRAHG